MWLDAFKPKSTDIQNIGVPGVPRVSAHAKPMNTRVLPHLTAGTQAVVPCVPIVPEANPNKRWDTEDTVGHNLQTKCPIGEKGQEPSIHAGSRLVGTPGTRGTPRDRYGPSNKDELLQSLTPFRIQDCLDDPELELIDRINDLAWHLMETDGLSFDAAIALAADITVHYQVAACERSYISVRELWIRLTL